MASRKKEEEPKRKLTASESAFEKKIDKTQFDKKPGRKGSRPLKASYGVLADPSPSPPEKQPKKQPPGFFDNLLNEASTGGKDPALKEKREKQRQQKEEFEQKYGQTDNSGSQIPANLPSLQALQHAQDALRERMGFRGDTYRPNYSNQEDTLPPKKPLLEEIPVVQQPVIEPPPSKFTNPDNNCSQVSLCKHEDLAIAWDPRDPDNQYISWRAFIKPYFNYVGAHGDHKSCSPANYLRRGNVLAGRIVDDFNRYETHNLTNKDIRDGKQPRREPNRRLVQREVQTMISHMFRDRKQETSDRREAARVRMDAEARRKELAEKSLQQAQSERQQGRASEGLNIDDLEADAQAKTKPTKQTKSSKATRVDVAQTLLQQRSFSKIIRGRPEPEDRYRITTMHERDTRREYVAQQVRRERALWEKQRVEAERNTYRRSRRGTAIEPTQSPYVEESDDDDEQHRRRRSPGRQNRRCPNLEEEDDGNDVPSPVKPNEEKGKKEKSAKKSEEKPGNKLKHTKDQNVKAKHKPKRSELTAEERALLAGIHKARAAEAEQNAADEAKAEESKTRASNADEEGEDSGARSEVSKSPTTSSKDEQPVKQSHLISPATKLADDKEREEVDKNRSDFDTAHKDEKDRQHKESGAKRDSSLPASNKSSSPGEGEIIEGLGASKAASLNEETTQNSEQQYTPVVDEEHDGAPDAESVQDDNEQVVTSKDERHNAQQTQDNPKEKEQEIRHKSEVVIDDSDDDAGYDLPKLFAGPSDTPVRQGWQEEAPALVEDVIQHQREIEQERKVAIEDGETVIVDESIKTVESQTVKTTTTLEAVDTTEVKDASPSRKRKDSPSLVDYRSSSDEEGSPTKKARKSPVEDNEVEEPRRSQAPSPEPTKIAQTPPTPASAPSSPPYSPSEDPSPTPSPRSPASNKRKSPSPLPCNEDNDDEAGAEPSNKKIKRVHFSPEVVSPKSEERKRSLPYVVDTEGDETLRPGDVGIEHETANENEGGAGHEDEAEYGSEGEYATQQGESSEEHDGLSNLFDDQSE